MTDEHRIMIVPNIREIISPITLRSIKTYTYIYSDAIVTV